MRHLKQRVRLCNKVLYTIVLHSNATHNASLQTSEVIGHKPKHLQIFFTQSDVLHSLQFATYFPMHQKGSKSKKKSCAQGGDWTQDGG